MIPAERPRSPLEPSTLAVILLFTLASALAINPYTYGSGDNSIAIPFLKASINPALYPGDYLLGQRSFYYTYLWDALGLVHALLGIGLPALFLATYGVALFGTFCGIYRIAYTLFESREVAVISLLFLLFSKTTLGGVETVENMLNTRGVATPILLFALHAFLERNIVRSFLLLGLAYLIHPMTTHYVLAMLVVAALVEARRGGLRRLAPGLATFVLVASPILAWKFRHTPPSLHLFSSDRGWLTALHQRSAHHMFPSSWGWSSLAHAVVTLVLFGIAWRHRNREAEDRHRVIASASATILALCVLGVLGSEVYPVGLVFVTQPLRSFQFLEYFATAYVAHDLYRRVASSEQRANALGAMLVALALAYGAQRHLLPAAILITMTAFMIARHRVWRNDLSGAGLVVAVTCLVGLAACVSVAVDRSAGDTTFSIVDDEKPLWLDVERWARTHTDVRDGFIVPPDEQVEFRVHSERTIYADVEDGGLMNSNPAFGREWLRRMSLLGVQDLRDYKPDFCRLGTAPLREIVREMKVTNRRVFLVWPCKHRVLPFPRRYRNRNYVVYEVG